MVIWETRSHSRYEDRNGAACSQIFVLARLPGLPISHVVLARPPDRRAACLDADDEEKIRKPPARVLPSCRCRGGWHSIDTSKRHCPLRTNWQGFGIRRQRQQRRPLPSSHRSPSSLPRRYRESLLRRWRSLRPLGAGRRRRRCSLRSPRAGHRLLPHYPPYRDRHRPPSRSRQCPSVCWVR